MAERTSWYAIEPGWEVQDRSGATIGEVVSVVGDEDEDIFDGLRLSTVDDEQAFAPGERVADIVEGCVRLDAELAELDDADAPGGVEISRDRDAEL